MKTTIIPAQITTIEDRIAGSLSLSQVLIILTPLIFLVLIYVILPPTMKMVTYKLVFTLVIAMGGVFLAIRVNGKIMAEWLKMIIKFRLKPKYYVFNKNSLNRREINRDEELLRRVEIRKKPKLEQKFKGLTPEINLTQTIIMENLIRKNNIALHYQFESRKNE